MEKNITERLFDGTAKEYDRKHIKNTSKKVIKESIINDIEANGISSEMLDRLGLPVYRYSTQVTVHGVFPDGCDIRVGGYKNLTKNGNGSLSVRYTAIDRTKKKELFELTRFATPDYWSIEDNSTHYALYHQEQIKDVEQFKALKAKAELINSRLAHYAFGNVYAYAARGLWGGLYGVILLNITAFYEKDMKRVFHAVNPDYEYTLQEARCGLAEQKEKERLEREARWAAYREQAARENAEKEERMKAQLATLRAEVEQYAVANGFTFCETLDLRNKKVQAIVIYKEWSDKYAISYRRYDGKNKMAKIQYCTAEWKERWDAHREKKTTDKMILKNVWVKAA